MNATSTPYSDNRARAHKLLALALSQGGVTLRPDGWPVQGDADGFVVGGRVPSFVRPLPTDGLSYAAGEVLKTEIAKWLQAQPFTTSWSGHMGSWIDYDRVLYVDLVDILDDEEEALVLAANRGERAIYDLGTGREIPVPSFSQAE